MSQMRNNLRTIRRSRKISILQLATEASVSTSTVLQTEKYGYLPGVDVRERIAEALKLSTEDVWPGLHIKVISGEENLAELR